MNPIIANQANSAVELLALQTYLDHKDLSFEAYMTNYKNASLAEQIEITHEYEIFKEEMRKYLIDKVIEDQIKE